MTCRELLKKLEWAGPRVPGYYDAKLYPTCPVCGASSEFGHVRDCALDAALHSKTVEVEIPEPDKDSGFCSLNCPFYPGDYSDDGCEKGWSVWRHHRHSTDIAPGPGCPWYEP